MPFRRLALAVYAGAALTACAPPPTRVAAAPPRPEPTAAPAVAPAVAPVAAAPAAPDVFVATVRPILLRHCVPCHEPGGKMYARMPFDNPDTLRTHREGVLRRLKVPEEHAAVEAWLGTP